MCVIQIRFYCYYFIGDSFGELALTEFGTRSATVIAAVDTTLGVLNKNDYQVSFIIIIIALLFVIESSHLRFAPRFTLTNHI